MSTTYLSVDYFPLTVNFFDRDAIELAEAKYGIRVDGAVCKLLCKIFKEGYYIPWGEEQSLIFARKLGGELKGKEIDGIIQILLDKGFFDKESYEKFQILTSLEIQHIWIDATCRRKRKLEDLPYLLVNDTQKQEKENNTKDANNSSVQGELKLENENISPEIADISGQSKGEKRKAEEEEDNTASPSLEIPGYAYNKSTHNVKGLLDSLAQHGVTNYKRQNKLFHFHKTFCSEFDIINTKQNVHFTKVVSPIYQFCLSLHQFSIGAKAPFIIKEINTTASS